MAVNCYCGLLARYRTSWTDNNPGRPYRVCPNNQENGGCTFFEFVGTPCCSRCKQIIPGLLRRLDVQRSDMEVQRDEIQRLEIVVERERAEFASFLQEIEDAELAHKQFIDKKIEAFAKKKERGTHRW